MVCNIAGSVRTGFKEEHISLPIISVIFICLSQTSPPQIIHLQ
jgi:hypothetical protein